MGQETDRETCQRFANQHKVIFEDDGEVGFGRECVGFISRSGGFLDHNPRRAPNYEAIEEAACELAHPGEGIFDAYHKHECMAILGRGAGAVSQLALWVRQLEAAGTVSVIQYETGQTGIGALINGVMGHAVMVKT